MKIISRDLYNQINEAVFGVRLSGYSKEDFERLTNTELTDALKQILLLSGGGFTTESISYLKTSLSKNDLLDESTFDSVDLSNSLNEDHLQFAEDIIKGTAAVGLAGAIGIGSYINFLSKKKPIKKAWKEVYKAKAKKDDIDLETWEEKEALKPELTKDEVADKVGQVETTISNKKEELDQVDKTWDENKKEAKEKLADTKKLLYELDPQSYKDPDAKTSVKAAKESLKEEESEDKGSEDKGPEGDLQRARKAVEDARPDEKEIEKEIAPIDKQIEGGIKKMKEFKGSAEDKAKAGKKWAKEKAKLQDNKRKIQDGESNKELVKAKKELDKVKKQIESEKKRLEKRKAEYKEYADGSTKETKEKLRTEVDELKKEIESIKERGKPKGSANDIQKLDDIAKKKKLNVDDEIKVLTDDADRISGTKGGGAEASGIGGKILGMSSGYTKKVKAELEKELLKKKQSNLEKMGNSDAAKNVDTLIKDADKRMADGDKELADSEKKVDASDEKKKEAQEKVAAKQAEDAEKKRKENVAKTAELNKEIANLQSGDSKGKDEKIANLQAQINKLQTSESVTAKIKIALLESELKKLGLKEEDIAMAGDNEKKDNDNTLVNKKVVLHDLLGTDMSHLEGSTGIVVKAFKEGEREPEGDLPRRTGDPEIFKVKLDDPRDPMYPDVNLTSKNIKIYKEKENKENKEEEVEESIASKFRQALNENKKK